MAKLCALHSPKNKKNKRLVGVRLFLSWLFSLLLFYMILEHLVWISSSIACFVKRRGMNFKIYCRNTTFWPSCVKWFRNKFFKRQSVCHLPAEESEVLRVQTSFLSVGNTLWIYIPRWPVFLVSNSNKEHRWIRL